MSHPGSRRPSRVALRLVLALVALAGCGDGGTGPVPGPAGAVAPLGAAGRWIVDAEGRVVLLHGVNHVAKQSPFYSAAFGFDEDDIAFLAEQGFDALRLGVDMRGAMPSPGQVDHGYIENLALTVEACRRHGLFVLLDIHQDGFAPKYRGNGFPDWMAIDDGLPNPPADFPLYYVLNPAMQRAFEHFWADDPIPGGTGKGGAGYVLEALAAVLARFGDDPVVFGHDLLNEPWPGARWEPCAYDRERGCPEAEQTLLAPFYRRGLELVRRLAPRQVLYVEPFVLFNFGQAPTTIPGPEPGFGLSFHSYALDVAGEEAVARLGREAAERDGAPVLVTEFGATTNIELVDRLLDQFDRELLPWMWWAYNEQFGGGPEGPVTAETVRNPDLLRALARPHATATAGIPTRIAFDAATRAFDYEYRAVRADGGGAFPAGAETTIAVPPMLYPAGWSATATGGRIVSAPCERPVRVRADAPGASVAVHVAPGAC